MIQLIAARIQAAKHLDQSQKKPTKIQRLPLGEQPTAKVEHTRLIDAGEHKGKGASSRFSGTKGRRSSNKRRVAQHQQTLRRKD